MPRKSFTEQHGESRNPRGTKRNPQKRKNVFSERGARFLFKPSHQSLNEGGLLLDWKPRGEALAISHLYKTKQINFEKARDLILMSEAQYQKLLAEKTALPGVLKAVQNMRLKCWIIFVSYVKGYKK
jgi:hypothetical protein